MKADPIRLNTVILAHARARTALDCAADAPPDVARECIQIALDQLAAAAGQLAHYAPEAAAAGAAYSAHIVGTDFIAAACSYRRTDGGRSIQQGLQFRRDQTDRIILDCRPGRLDSPEHLHAWVSTHGGDPATLRLSCRGADDATRSELIAAGWPIVYPTEAAEILADAEAAARSHAATQAARAARSGQQATDTAVPIDATPDVSLEHIWAVAPDGARRIPVRLKSEGYGFLPDGALEELLVGPKVCASILYAADAIARGFIGSITGGPLREICYELDGSRWYLYANTQSMGDTWQEEWWVSTQRLTARAGADAIESSRELARC